MTVRRPKYSNRFSSVVVPWAGAVGLALTGLFQLGSVIGRLYSNDEGQKDTRTIAREDRNRSEDRTIQDIRDGLRRHDEQLTRIDGRVDQIYNLMLAERQGRK